MGLGTLCVDVTKTVGTVSCIFQDINGSNLAVTFLDGDHNGVWCWPAKVMCCGPCPTIISGSDIITCSGHAKGVDFTATEAIDPQSITWGYEIISGTGTVSFSNATGPATTVTYTPGPGEVNTAAQVLIKVGDPQQTFDQCCTSWHVMNVGIYMAGDPNKDGGKNLGDAVFLINYIFKGGPPPDPVELGDLNCNGAVNVGDAVRQINYLFRFGPDACCPW